MTLGYLFNLHLKDSEFDCRMGIFFSIFMNIKYVIYKEIAFDLYAPYCDIEPLNYMH